jgi:fermentation-respiration switch protein FrsA (DUF1100 family)
MMRAALAFAALVAAVGIAAWLGQRRLIYFPGAAHVPRAAEVLGPGAVDAHIPTEDGIELGGWYLPAPRGDEAGRVVIVFNGNAGSRRDRAHLAAGFARAGWSVLLFDYRGFGGNAGRPDEPGLLRDARAARAWLDTRPEVERTRIVYFGESLGAAVAIGLAIDRPPHALVLRSPFTSLPEVARVHYPWLPVGWMLRDRFPSIERIRSLSQPLIVIAGERDTIVPHAQSRALFDAAPAATKRFVSLPGANHNDPRLSHGAEMLGPVVEFLEAIE